MNTSRSKRTKQGFHFRKEQLHSTLSKKLSNLGPNSMTHWVLSVCELYVKKFSAQTVLVYRQYRLGFAGLHSSAKYPFPKASDGIHLQIS